jgi:hypothetical protein
MKLRESLPPFLPGTKIVAIESHNPFTEGDVFVANSVEKCLCGCGSWVVHINVETFGEFFHFEKKVKPNFFLTSRFRPLESKPFPLMTFTEIKEKELEEILIDN